MLDFMFYIIPELSVAKTPNVGKEVLRPSVSIMQNMNAFPSVLFEILGHQLLKIKL